MKTWGEMSDAEQGALLLAHHRGEVIELYNPVGFRIWVDLTSGEWKDHVYYRVKKEPVIEVQNRTIDVCGGLMGVSVVATCTYTDGKLTKIHWEADQ